MEVRHVITIYNFIGLILLPLLQFIHLFSLIPAV